MQHSDFYRLAKFSQSTAFADERGFTLTELAIVMAILGTILGGIFIAASSAQYRIRLNQGIDEVSLIVANIRSLYAGQNALAAPAINFGAASAATFVSQGVFPKEMLSPATNLPNHPWDTTAANGSVGIQINNPTAGQFIVQYINLPVDVCTDLLLKNSAPGSDTGLVKIVVGTVTCPTNACSLPVTPVQAAAACSIGGGLPAINWYYTLGS